MDNAAPDVITQDRSDVYEIISEMLDNPDTYGLYPTTKAYNNLEALLNKVRIESVGWTWAEACIQLDKGKDPREYEQGQLIERATKDLNPPWRYKEDPA